MASIRQCLAQDEAQTTRRLIRAAENPCVHILGHLSGRLLLEREPYKFDVQAVIDACAATGTWIELNCNPYRFDMDWRHWPYAKSKGVKCVINPDAHRAEHVGFLRLGAGIGRKGWLTKEDVMNTLPLNKLVKETKRSAPGRNGPRFSLNPVQPTGGPLGEQFWKKAVMRLALLRRPAGSNSLGLFDLALPEGQSRFHPPHRNSA